MSTYALKQLQAHPRAGRITLLAVGLFSVFLLLLAYAFLGEAGQTGLAPPADFQPMAEIDLSAGPYNAETLGQFIVEEAAVVGIFFSIQGIDTPYFDLRLTGPDDESPVILHSEDYRTDADGGGLWEKSLAPGTYRLELTARQSPGALTVYWGYR